MILKLSHTHDHNHDHSTQLFSSEILQSILSASQEVLNDGTCDQISRLQRYYEEKVYLSYSNDPNQYLLHMLHKSENDTKDQVAEMIMSRQMKVTTAIKNEKYHVKVNNDRQKIKKIQDELSGKIQAMKKGIASISGSQSVPVNISNLSKSVTKDMNNQSQQIYNGYMQFRKKGYWNDKSEQSIKVKKFISKMHKKRKEVEQAHEKIIKQMQKNNKEAEENQKKQKEEEKKKIQEELTKRIEKQHQQREAKKNQDKKRLAQAQNFINKYKNEKPIYLLNQQKFKRQVMAPMEAEYKRKLIEIRKAKRQVDAEQIELHQQRYEEFRQKLVETYEKKQQDRQIYEKNMEKLQQLYHGHFHEQLQEQLSAKSYKNILQEKRRNREKIIAYNQSIKEEFKPKVDDKKRQEVENTIKLLQRKGQKGKKRIFKGNDVILEELNPDQHKKLGVSYLQNLKKMNQGVKRKTAEDRSSSMMELHKKPAYHDYLKEMRANSRNQTARSNHSQSNKRQWEKILNQQSFSNRDKYNSVMDHVTLLESEAKQKQLELKYMRNGTRAMQLKEKLDKYYLESVAAKMHVLKDVILKD